MIKPWAPPTPATLWKVWTETLIGDSSSFFLGMTEQRLINKVLLVKVFDALFSKSAQGVGTESQGLKYQKRGVGAKPQGLLLINSMQWHVGFVYKEMKPC